VLREAETGDPPEAAENPRAIAALRLLMFTGMRRNEAIRLRWSEVDLDAGILRLPDSKTGAKVVRLNGAAKEVIEAQEPMLGNPYVFPSPMIPGAPLYDVKGVWARIRKRAGLGDVRLHDLRHNFAAAAAAGGLSLFQIGQLLGHRNPRTTARYADLVDDAAARAAEQVGEALTRAMNKNVEEG
jgi:integrase